DPLDSTNTPAEDTRWENMTKFFAQLTAVSKHADFSLWAWFALRDAFGPWKNTTSPTDAAVRAACLWYIYAGKSL
ncbi:uncharacterized protein K452DRAFT_207583, partial [Aplosporella prunicola CBS 121167]